MFAILLVSAFSGGIAPAMSAESEPSDSDLYIQILLTSNISKNKEEKQSLFGKQLYAEKSLSFAEDWSVWGLAYKDQEFAAIYAGLVKKGWQLATSDWWGSGTVRERSSYRYKSMGVLLT